MYDHIERIMRASNVAKVLDEPVNMNKDGQIVDDEMDGYGFKVPIEITRPDMCLMLDECGCNTAQEGDPRIGNEMFLAGIHDKAYSSISKKDIHFTHIGVNLLSGDAIMCVAIISGKTHDILVELGIDADILSTFDEDFTNIDEASRDKKLLDLLRDNCGPGKLFPGLPSCTYKGKTIPGYVAFSESGGITPTILTNTF